MSRSFHTWAACTQGCHPFLGSRSPNAKDRWSTRDMTEPRVQELEQGHPCADDFTAWHSQQAQLFQLTPRAHAARRWGESSADELTANKLVRIKILPIDRPGQREALGFPAV